MRRRLRRRSEERRRGRGNRSENRSKNRSETADANPSPDDVDVHTRPVNRRRGLLDIQLAQEREAAAGGRRVTREVSQPPRLAQARPRVCAKRAKRANRAKRAKRAKRPPTRRPRPPTSTTRLVRSRRRLPTRGCSRSARSSEPVAAAGTAGEVPFVRQKRPKTAAPITRVGRGSFVVDRIGSFAGRRRVPRVASSPLASGHPARGGGQGGEFVWFPPSPKTFRQTFRLGGSSPARVPVGRGTCRTRGAARPVGLRALLAEEEDARLAAELAAAEADAAAKVQVPPLDKKEKAKSIVGGLARVTRDPVGTHDRPTELIKAGTAGMTRRATGRTRLGVGTRPPAKKKASSSPSFEPRRGCGCRRGRRSGCETGPSRWRRVRRRARVRAGEAEGIPERDETSRVGASAARERSRRTLAARGATTALILILGEIGNFNAKWSGVHLS